MPLSLWTQQFMPCISNCCGWFTTCLTHSNERASVARLAVRVAHAVIREPHLTP